MKKTSTIILAVLAIFCFYGQAVATCTGPSCTEEASFSTTIDAVVEIHAAKAYNDPVTNLVVQDMILKISGIPCSGQEFQATINADHYAGFQLSDPNLREAYTEQRQSWNANHPGGLVFEFEQSGKTATAIFIGEGINGAGGLAQTDFSATANDQCTGCGEKHLSGEVFTSNGVVVWLDEYSDIPDGGNTQTVNTGAHGNFNFSGVVNAPNPTIALEGKLDLTAQAVAENKDGIAAGVVSLNHLQIVNTNCAQLEKSASGNVNAYTAASNNAFTASISGGINTPQ